MSALSTKLETLAMHGGKPVRERLLPYGRQSLDDADVQAVVEVLKSDWLTTARATTTGGKAADRISNRSG